MSRVIHISAAATQLTRALFNETQIEGCVVAGDEGLEVAVQGTWSGEKLRSFAGYDVTWRQAA